MNYWAYSIVFDKSLTMDELVRFASCVPQYLISHGTRPDMDKDGCRFILTIDHNGEEQFFGSVEDAIPILANSGGGLIVLRFQQNSLDSWIFSFEVSPPKLSLLSGGSLGNKDIELEAKIRSAFYWMCENLDPIFGNSEDLYTVENIWHQFGIDGWDGLGAVGSLEQEDIQNGIIPDVLAWLTYFDTTRFSGYQGDLAALSGVSKESIGSRGLMIRLADYPWNARFAIRSDEGYQVVDEFARRPIDGKKVMPSHLDRVKHEIENRKRA